MFRHTKVSVYLSFEGVQHVAFLLLQAIIVNAIK